MLRLAVQIRVDLTASALRLVAGGDDARQLLLERFAGMTESLHGRRGLGLRHAQCRQRRFRLDAVPLLGECRLGRGGDGPLDLAQSRGDALRVGVGGMPTRCKQQRLGLSDLIAEPTIALRLPSLLAQRLDLHRKRRDDIVDPCEVCFGALQLQFGLVAAGMEPGRTGGLVEEQAALGRLRGDQGGDPALADQSRRVRSRRGIGEQELDVAGPHIAAVDHV